MEKGSGNGIGLMRPWNRLPVSIYCIAAIWLLSIWYILQTEWTETSPQAALLEQHHLKILEEGLQKCSDDRKILDRSNNPARINPRFNPSNGQPGGIWLRNATVFDGEKFFDHAQDIYFIKGTIATIRPTFGSPAEAVIPGEWTMVDAQGKWVTPGLVDMHSHHIVMLPGSSDITDDANEVNPDFGPLTPFVRSLDGMKAYDHIATLIAAGGVTSSLILPGSANIMGGEAFPVKNLLRSGPDGEEVVEELLLEYGLPQNHRQRYMKMACGENPKRVYDHTRMGNAFKLREQMAKGKDLLTKQNEWCLSAAAARETGDMQAMRHLTTSAHGKPGYPEELKLDSTVAMLRGKVNVNIHCYEPEDLEDMIRHSHEFGFPINAFHHAIEAWRVPEMIKNSGHNITIATFQDFALYKIEAYLASLHAGKILTDHGVAVAYKSDHTGEDLNARYLLSQAAGAHSFGLSAELALRSVTSVPAISMNQGHRIGFVRAGHDADLVIWDSHPLSIGATPVEVYIDGKPTINNAVYLADTQQRATVAVAPFSKKELSMTEREETCKSVQEAKRLVFTGISKSFASLAGMKIALSSDDKMIMILDSGKISCFGYPTECIHDAASDTVIALENGHILPGLTAVNEQLGLSEVATEDSQSDGEISSKVSIFDPNSVVYAKYGIHLDGAGFERAKIGGVTRSVVPPQSSGAFIRGASTAFKTTGNESILDGAIVSEDVALHVMIGLKAKSETTPTISDQISKLHHLLVENKGKDSIYGKAADGTIPLVVHATNKYDILQLIKLKQQHNSTNLVILGGHGAPAVAYELAAANIPLIFTAHRGQEDFWEKKDVLPGPPLSKSPTRLLVEAGVTFAIAQISDFAPTGTSIIHNLLLDASWASKWAGLSEQQAVDLVSRNVEEILGLPTSEEIVIYEGNPLEYGASVVVSIDTSKGVVTECWPTVV